MKLLAAVISHFSCAGVHWPPVLFAPDPFRGEKQMLFCGVMTSLLLALAQNHKKKGNNVESLDAAASCGITHRTLQSEHIR